MQKLNRNQGIAIAASLGILGYILFSGPLMNFFNPQPSANTNPMTQNTLQVEDQVTGQGEVAGPGDLLTVHYTGMLEDGRVFESSKTANTPINFTLGVGAVIRGWDEGLVGMREGGKRRLTIPPEYGYGSQAVGPIPANSTLIFDVELVGVEKAAPTE